MERHFGLRSLFSNDNRSVSGHLAASSRCFSLLQLASDPVGKLYGNGNGYTSGDKIIIVMATVIITVTIMVIGMLVLL